MKVVSMDTSTLGMNHGDLFDARMDGVALEMSRSVGPVPWLRIRLPQGVTKHNAEKFAEFLGLKTDEGIPEIETAVKKAASKKGKQRKATSRGKRPRKSSPLSRPKVRKRMSSVYDSDSVTEDDHDEKSDAKRSKVVRFSTKGSKCCFSHAQFFLLTMRSVTDEGGSSKASKGSK